MKVNFGMWRQAVTIMPRIEDEEWRGLDFVSRWLVSTRFAAIVLTVIAALLAGLLAFRVANFNPLIWAIFALSLVFAHATNNILNDLVDFKRGVDRDNYFRDQYGPQPLERGFKTAKQQFWYAAANGFLALAGGAVLVLHRGGMTLPFMAAGAIFVLFYTFPLKYFALGEISLLIVYGPLMIGGGYYLLTGGWDWNVVIASLPFGLGVSATLFGKHIDKIDMDREAHVHTLPVVIGEVPARVVTVVMIVLQFLITAYLVFIGYFTVVMAIVLVTLPDFFKSVLPMYRRPRPKERPDWYPADRWPLWYVGSVFRFTRRFGSWYVFAILLDTLIRLLYMKA